MLFLTTLWVQDMSGNLRNGMSVPLIHIPCANAVENKQQTANADLKCVIGMEVPGAIPIYSLYDVQTSNSKMTTEFLTKHCVLNFIGNGIMFL